MSRAREDARAITTKTLGAKAAARFALAALLAWMGAGLPGCATRHAGNGPPSEPKPVPVVDTEEALQATRGPGPVTPPPADLPESPVPVGPSDPQWGNADALVTIVVFNDFQCPFCARVQPTLQQIRDKYAPTQVRLVWKDRPLPFHEHARPTHEAAEAVFQLGGARAFWVFHDLAFDNQKSLTRENFEKWARQADVDVVRFKELAGRTRIAESVQADMDLADEIGALGTPSFRINGVTLSGAQPFGRFQEIIDDQLVRARELVEAGTDPTHLYAILSSRNFEAPKPVEEAPRHAPDADKTVWKVPVDKTDPVDGPVDALVTIVEWGDFQCPFCARVVPTLERLRQEYPNDVRIVWKDNPLPFHKRAAAAAVLAREAQQLKGNAGFWAAHTLLFENQRSLEDADLERYAKELGVPWWRVKNALKSNKYETRFDASVAMATDLEARGTPHFFVNGRRLPGAQPYEVFQKLVDERLADAQALVAGGVARRAVYATILRDAKGPPPPEQKNVPAPGGDSASKGPKSAPIVIQQFSDFQCPFCARVEPTITQVMAKYPKQVKVVWRHLPLDFHKDAKLAAEAAQEVFAQRGAATFWKYHDLLFANQSDLTRPALERHALALGINMGQFRAALDSGKHRALVERDAQIAASAGIRGTPGFTVNGYFVSGAQPYAAFDRMIRYALSVSP